MSAKRQQVASAELIAKYFIWKSNEVQRPITNKKLQKLLYYAQAWHLVLRDNQPLFKEEIEAWIHGPAIRKVYGIYKQYGFSPIQLEVKQNDIKKIKDLSILEQVWSVYGKYDSEYLEMLSHNEAPWINARQGLDCGDPSNNIISHESLIEYFSSLQKEHVSK